MMQHDGRPTDSTLREAVEELAPVLLLEIAQLGLRLGLGTRELTVLGMLVWRGEATISDLASELSIPPSTMTAVIDRLEQRGLVSRRSMLEDRRLVTLRATARGLKALKPVARSFAEQLLQAVPFLDTAAGGDRLRRFPPAEPLLGSLAASTK